MSANVVCQACQSERTSVWLFVAIEIFALKNSQHNPNAETTNRIKHTLGREGQSQLTPAPAEPLGALERFGVLERASHVVVLGH